MPQNLEHGQKYQVLDAMGLRLWLSKDQAVLVSKQPIFCAAYLVILPSLLMLDDAETHKIFSGMLKVLAINPGKIAIAGIRDHLNFSEHKKIIQQEILKWAPKTVLVMGEALAQAIGTLDAAIFLQITYDPMFLKHYPQHKKQAYQDLLQLKERLLIEEKAA
jgi:hypothetical protein